MSADMYVDYKSHLSHGNVWEVEVGLPLEIEEDDDESVDQIDVTVDIIAPNRELARYIVSVMYPDSKYISVSNIPEVE